MEGIPDRSGRRLFTERLPARSRLTRRNRASRKRSEGDGTATGVSEARWHRERAEEETPREKPGAAR